MLKKLLVSQLLCLCCSAQTVITHGGEYNLAIYNSNPIAACIAVETTEPVTISGWFWSAGDGIDVFWHGANVTVQNARFFAINAGHNETATAINADGAQFFAVENCYMTGFNEGISATGDNVTNPVVAISQNQIVHATGPASGDIQLIDMTGITGTIWANEILHNESAQASDCINLFSVQGQEYNHFSVDGNLVLGALDNNYATWMPNSGITTDGTAGNWCKYVDIDDNTVVHCSVGINLSHHGPQRAVGNTVVSDGIMSNGEHYPWLAYGIKGYYPSGNDVLRDNWVAVQSIYGRTDWSFYHLTANGNIALWPGQTVTEEMEQWAVNQWRQGNRQNGITIGPQ